MEIIVYCNLALGCCERGRCYGETNVKTMTTGTKITYQNWTNTDNADLVAKYGLTKSPTIIIFQRGAILKKIIGKNLDNQIKALLVEAPLSIKTDLEKNPILQRYIESKEREKEEERNKLR